MIEFFATSFSILALAVSCYALYRGGPKGDTGETGCQGIQGIQGEKGDSGILTSLPASTIQKPKEDLTSAKQIKDLETRVQTLRAELRREILCFKYCQCDEPNCHESQCLRSVRYLVTAKQTNGNKNLLMCGICFLRLKELQKIESFEDLEPPKVAPFRRPAFQNEDDKQRARLGEYYGER